MVSLVIDDGWTIEATGSSSRLTPRPSASGGSHLAEGPDGLGPFQPAPLLSVVDPAAST